MHSLKDFLFHLLDIKLNKYNRKGNFSWFFIYPPLHQGKMYSLPCGEFCFRIVCFRLYLIMTWKDILARSCLKQRLWNSLVSLICNLLLNRYSDLVTMYDERDQTTNVNQLISLLTVWWLYRTRFQCILHVRILE